MDKQDTQAIPFTGFPMETPEMLIGRPAENPYQGNDTDNDFSRDTQTWD